MNDEEKIKNELLKSYFAGRLKLHEIERFTNHNNAVTTRRTAIEKICETNLSNLGKYTISEEPLYGRNIENMIGAVQIPVGIVENLLVKGKYAKGRFYIPMATTEGALVASVNRGSAAVFLCNGIETRITKEGMTRFAIYPVRDLDEAESLMDWIRNSENFISM